MGCTHFPLAIFMYILYNEQDRRLNDMPWLRTGYIWQLCRAGQLG